MQVFEAGDGDKSVFGPQSFTGTEVRLDALPVKAFQSYRVVVRVSGYDEAAETVKIDAYNTQLLIGLKKAQNSNQVGLIVGLSVGGAVLVAGIIVLVIFLMKRKKGNTKYEKFTDA